MGMAVRMTVVQRGRHRGVRVHEARQRVEGLAYVLVVLDHHRDGVGEHLRGQFVDAENGQSAGPVQGFGDAGRLAQFQLPQTADDVDELRGQRVGQSGLLRAHDLEFPFGGRVVQEQVQTAPLQRGRQVPGVVRGQDHVRRVLGRERADLGNRDLVLAEQFQQHRLQGLVGPVDLVDQQHDRILGSHRLQQRARGQEPVGEEHALLGADPLHRLAQIGGVGDDLADLLPQDLGVEQLLAVVPLVECLGLVLTFVALQPQQPPAGGGGENLGQLGLPDPGRPLDQQRFVQPGLQEHGGGQALVGDVTLSGERLAHLLYGREHQGSSSSRSPFMQCSTTGRTVSNVHSLALPGVQASPRTWLVMRSTSALSPLITGAFS